MRNTLIKAICRSAIQFTAIALISSVVLLIPSILLISCNPSGNENAVWRYMGENTFSINDVFWFDYYKETAVGPVFWQLEFGDTSIIEHRSYGFKLLHQREIRYEIRKDTLVLHYPADYVYDKFNKEGEFHRLSIEKWLMAESKDNLTLTSVSRTSMIRDKIAEYQPTVYHFHKPLNKQMFPDYLVPYPTNKSEVINILNDLYSDKGRAQLKRYFMDLPDSLNDDLSYFGPAMIFDDLDKVFDIGNSPVIQQLFDHYHPFPIASRIIEVYLENEKGFEH